MKRILMFLVMNLILSGNVLAQEAIVQPCVDYGRSFLNTSKATGNAPRFWVESRCIIREGEKEVVFYQGGICKRENAFAKRDIFIKDTCDFMPIFSDELGGIFFRRTKNVWQRQVIPKERFVWGDLKHIETFKGRVLSTPEQIFTAMRAGKPMVGQTEIRKSGKIVILEYPIKTINFRETDGAWTVDTGPIVLPDLSLPLDKITEGMVIAHIGYSNWDGADFAIEQPSIERRKITRLKRTYTHTLAHFETKNVLLTHDFE